MEVGGYRGVRLLLRYGSSSTDSRVIKLESSENDAKLRERIHSSWFGGKPEG